MFNRDHFCMINTHRYLFFVQELFNLLHGVFIIYLYDEHAALSNCHLYQEMKLTGLNI